MSDLRFAPFVLTMVDWTIARQFRVSGAFLTDGTSRAGRFSSAYLAEGIGAALRISRQLGDRRRITQLSESLSEVPRFVLSLIIGGVRRSPVDPALRVDQSAHALPAVLGAIRNGITDVRC